MTLRNITSTKINVHKIHTQFCKHKMTLSDSRRVSSHHHQKFENNQLETKQFQDVFSQHTDTQQHVTCRTGLWNTWESKLLYERQR